MSHRVCSDKEAMRIIGVLPMVSKTERETGGGRVLLDLTDLEVSLQYHCAAIKAPPASAPRSAEPVGQMGGVVRMRIYGRLRFRSSAAGGGTEGHSRWELGIFNLHMYVPAITTDVAREGLSMTP